MPAEMSRQLWLLALTGLALAEPLLPCEDAADWEECLPEEDTRLLQVGVRSLTTQPSRLGMEFWTIDCLSLREAILGELNG